MVKDQTELKIWSAIIEPGACHALIHLISDPEPSAGGRGEQPNTNDQDTRSNTPWPRAGELGTAEKEQRMHPIHGNTLLQLSEKCMRIIPMIYQLKFAGPWPGRVRSSILVIGYWLFPPTPRPGLRI